MSDRTERTTSEDSSAPGRIERLKAKAERLFDRAPAPVRATLEIAGRTVADFMADGSPRLAAAISYFVLITLAPLLMLAVTFAGILFERADVRATILELVGTWTGDAGVVVVAEVLTGIAEAQAGGGLTFAGIAVALFGASVLFHQLQAALNIIWDVPEPGDGVLGVIRRRALTFLMVVVVGVLLIAAMLLGSGIVDLLESFVPLFGQVGWLTEWFISLAAATVLFAIVFTILPDRSIAWRDTLVGAFVTSLLFNGGAAIIGRYLATSGTGSVYGAASSFAVFLVWLFYSTQVFLLGAQFTHVWAERREAARDS